MSGLADPPTKRGLPLINGANFWAGDIAQNRLLLCGGFKPVMSFGVGNYRHDVIKTTVIYTPGNTLMNTGTVYYPCADPSNESGARMTATLAGMNEPHSI